MPFGQPQQRYRIVAPADPIRQGSHAFVAVHNQGRDAYMRFVAGISRCTEKETKMSRNTSTLISRFRRWRRYRDTVRELQGLTARELNDLGINRGEISRLAREASRL